MVISSYKETNDPNWKIKFALIKVNFHYPETVRNTYLVTIGDPNDPIMSKSFSLEKEAHSCYSQIMFMDIVTIDKLKELGLE